MPMAKGKSGDDSPSETRSKKPDYSRLEELGFAQCSLDEAALIMGRAHYKKAFGKDARKAYEKGRAAGLNELRKAELSMAKKSVAMATTLGRRYLGQAEQREQNGSGPIDYASIKERHRERIRAILVAEETEPD
jgi:hypothetical protein